MHFNLDLLFKESRKTRRKSADEGADRRRNTYQCSRKTGGNHKPPLKRGWLFFVHWQVDIHTGLSPTSVRPRLFGCFST